MTIGALRVRGWREQRTARGCCHGVGCRKPATGYLCEACKRKTAPQAAAMMRTLRSARSFLSIMERLAQGLCVTCLEPYRDPTGRRWRCKACRKKLPYKDFRSTPSYSWLDTPIPAQRTLAPVRPIPLAF